MLVKAICVDQGVARRTLVHLVLVLVLVLMLVMLAVMRVLAPKEVSLGRRGLALCLSSAAQESARQSWAWSWRCGSAARSSTLTPCRCGRGRSQSCKCARRAHGRVPMACFAGIRCTAACPLQRPR